MMAFVARQQSVFTRNWLRSVLIEMKLVSVASYRLNPADRGEALSPTWTVVPQ